MTASPLIPIENIYYLFCYAWDRFEEAQTVPVGGAASPDLPNLLAKVLLLGVRRLLSRGLDRSYALHCEITPTLRGRIVLGETLSLQARRVRRLCCEYDELSHDNLENRILKASLKRLCRAPTLNPDLSRQLSVVVKRFSDVTDISLNHSAFANAKRSSHKPFYDFLLKVSELAFDCLLPTPNGHGYVFRDVLRDERKMAKVFEAFVRNFYRAEQQHFTVRPLSIQWDAVAEIEAQVSKLPNMYVDALLQSPSRRIIIDTKYYASALQSNRGNVSYHSANLYQLFSYLKNAAGKDSEFSGAEGILLYPEVQRCLRDCYVIQGHRVSIATVDLSRPWPAIASDLLGLLSPADC